jgi:hypothetical protein
MKLIDLEKILQNRYNHLLLGEILIMVIYPVLCGLKIEFPVAGGIFLLAIIPALHVVLHFKPFLALMSLAVFGYILQVLAYFQLFPAESETNVLTLVNIAYAVFILLAIVIMVKKISSRKVVTSDTIKGGISVYFLMGILWAFLYQLLLRINPNALSHVTEERVDCFYYSFSTLTTLGPGDITPTTVHAKFLAILEAFVGQVYLAIFIALLIGLHLGKRLRRTEWTWNPIESETWSSHQTLSEEDFG